MRAFGSSPPPHRNSPWIVALTSSLLAATFCSAQAPVPGNAMPLPRLLGVTPMGGKTGSTLELTFTGQDLEEPQALLFSHPGIKAEPIVPPAPPPPPAPPMPDPKKPMPAPAAKPATPPPPITKFKVAIAPDVPLGIHDVRFANKWGVSNPRAFVVGDLPEAQEKEPNNDVPQAQRLEMNSTANGSISGAADVDYYVVAAKKGQRVVCSCLTTSIDSRMHAGLELFDAAGKRLASNRGYSNGDALLDYTAPADGDLFLRVFEFTYTLGGPAYFYRVTVSTAPWIDAIYPPMVEPGKTAQLTVYGRNLPGGQSDPTSVLNRSVLEKMTVTVNRPADAHTRQALQFSGRVSPLAAALDGFEFRLHNGAGSSNPYLLTYARAPVFVDNGDNDTWQKAQELAVPCDLAGRIEKKRDRDWYAFAAKKGDAYIIELLGDRLGTEVDLNLTVKRVDNNASVDIGDFDDNAEVLNPIKFFTKTDDPAPYKFVAPADGKYLLLVTSRDGDVRSSPRLLYRLRIEPERPDFHLIVMPADDFRPDGTVLPRGGQQALTVFVWRHEGFTGEVTLRAEGLPAGVKCSTQVVGKTMKQASIILSAAADAPLSAGEIQIRGTATIQGQPVERTARPASMTWPIQVGQQIPAIARLERSLAIAVRDKAPYNLAATVDKVTIQQDTKVTAALKLNRQSPDFKTPLTITAFELPPNLTFNNGQPVTIPQDKNEATAVFDVKGNVQPGTYTVVLRGRAQIPYNKDPMAKQKPNIDVTYPSNEVSFTVLPKQVATLSVANATVPLKVGNQAEIVVKVARLHDYAGEFKVSLTLPMGVKGLSADEVVIPAGKDEAKLIVRAMPDTAPANHANLTLKAVAALGNNLTATQETKITLNVMK